jgi:cysteine desulfurase
MKRIYLDYAATTPTDPEVVEAMLPYFSGRFANPASAHADGAQAADAIESARDAVGKLIGAKARDIVFTSGGTESDNTAVKGITATSRAREPHVVTTAIEHKAVLEPCRAREAQGVRVTYLAVDAAGRIDPADVERALTPSTTLVSVMHANNEIGTIQPIAEIGRIVRRHGAAFNVDAVQTCGHVPVDVDGAKIDLLSLSGHKLYGPKGVGALYVRRGTAFAPLLHGGSQEDGRRASTLNVPAIVGLGRAAQLARARLDEEARTVGALRDRLVRGILERVPGSRLNGHPHDRLPGNAHLSFADVDGEVLLMQLDKAGVSAATGSACVARDTGPSHVLTAIGLPDDLLGGSLRLSLGRGLTEADIDQVLELLPPLVHKVRSLAEFLD